MNCWMACSFLDKRFNVDVIKDKAGFLPYLCSFQLDCMFVNFCLKCGKAGGKVRQLVNTDLLVIIQMDKSSFLIDLCDWESSNFYLIFPTCTALQFIGSMYKQVPPK